MIISKTPLRISFFGGSTDNPAFIKKFKNSLVREVLKFHKLPPLSIYLTSDLFSSGSGLASSSSFLLSLLKAIYQFKDIKKNKIDLAQESLSIERKFNPFCGYQDTFGCAIPGLKIIKTSIK